MSFDGCVVSQNVQSYDLTFCLIYFLFSISKKAAGFLCSESFFFKTDFGF